MNAGGHERERLSAYLDGELPAAEAAGVAAHVASCAECARLLADMAAVDERFADAPVEAPQGYFDTYASRVRARIGAEPRRTPKRVPAWTWAVAAVLVLAVVTPLTLRGRMAAPTPPAPVEATKGASAAAARAQPVARTDATPASGLAKATSERQQEQAPAATGGAVGRQERVAEAAPGRGAGTASQTAAAPAAPAAPPPTGGGLEAEALAEAALKADEAANATVPPSKAARGAAGSLQEAPRPAAAPAAAPMAADAVVGYGATASAERRAKPAAVAAPDDVPGRETAAASFSRLTSAAPRTAAEWRLARESWRAFATGHPSDPRADEARVRAVEAAFEAWRADRDAADRRVLESDARAYLARGDAAQRERVSDLLRRAERLAR